VLKSCYLRSPEPWLSLSSLDCKLGDYYV
jgi:hypothetical protein